LIRLFFSSKESQLAKMHFLKLKISLKTKDKD